MTMKRTMNRKYLVAPLFALLAHCAGGGPATSAQPPAPDGGASDDAGIDAGELAPDSQAATPRGDAGGCDGGNGTADPPDDMGIDANCDGADGVIGKDVYVDANVGQDTNAGSPSAPLQTLSAGLNLATSRGGNVLVAAGTLQEDDLSAPGTWAIYGGYSATFLGAPKRALTIVAPPATGLRIEQASSARLAHMTVQAQAPQPGTQGAGSPDGGVAGSPLSAHAVRSSATKLALDDMVLFAPKGADGAAGAAGPTGQAGNTSNTCGGFRSPQSALGSYYNGTPPGMSPDRMTPAGNVPNKVPAKQAEAGYPGSDGNDAAGTLSLVGGLVDEDIGTAGRDDGSVGYGGASGGYGTVPAGTYKGEWMGGGAGGNGGCPAAGGKPGTSAGSSVALLVLSGEVSVTRSSLQAGLGGTGGDGGAGGPGGLGQTGLAWSPLVVPATCTPPNDVYEVNCAGYGGQGGNGGAGGHGGGGAGGWSIGILMAPGTTSTVDSETTVTVSKGGVGGSGNGGSRAPSGLAHAQYALP